MEHLEAWFAANGWAPFPFQRRVWQSYAVGKSGLIHSATGTGKTLAAFGGPLGAGGKGLQVLWLTPLRALAADTVESLQLAANLRGWRVQARTGDTSSTNKAKQLAALPEVLVTTPESLSLLLSRADARSTLGSLRCVVVDEWHELMASKRGVMAELCLARLRRWNPDLRVWGLSATLGNLDVAMETLLGPGRRGELVQGDVEKRIVIDTILPPNIERFPWAGHLGTRMAPLVADELKAGETSLVFCNTRSQTELWFNALEAALPEWKGLIQIHHGSLDPEIRAAVEQGLKAGKLRCVVCTSSLDLGVDFTPVDRVFQVGSPKGVARLLQRAGRSGHQPGAASRVTCVPTHALELVDIASARQAALEGAIEGRDPIEKPLDLLVQHCVTLALGEPFDPEELRREIQDTRAYRDLQEDEWQWVLDFIARGGKSLQAYPEYRRVAEREGKYGVEDPKIAYRHRMSVGTIVSDAAMEVRLQTGGRIGTVEESFVSRLSKGDKFLFSGQFLEFVRVKDMACIVKKATSSKGAVPRWAGGRLPLSSELSHSIRLRLQEARNQQLSSPEMEWVRPILQVQSEWSRIPREDELLVERVSTRDGHHLFIYPFEGRIVHEGLAALFAYRMGRIRPITFTLACNDYGIELLSDTPAPFEDAIEEGLFSTNALVGDIARSLNSVEMAKRQFREIARIAGLVFSGYPGKGKTVKQLQASSGLFYDVFCQYDPTNLLLRQADREVMDRQLESSRLASTLRRLQVSELAIETPPHPTPLAFPILVDRLRETLSTESLGDRIEKLVGRLERMAGPA